MGQNTGGRFDCGAPMRQAVGTGLRQRAGALGAATLLYWLGGCSGQVVPADAQQDSTWAAGELPGAGENPGPQSVVQGVTCEVPAVGPSNMRRLTHREYEHSVRDLLGATSAPARAFAPDSQVGLFDNRATRQGDGIRPRVACHPQVEMSGPCLK